LAKVLYVGKRLLTTQLTQPLITNIYVVRGFFIFKDMTNKQALAYILTGDKRHIFKSRTYSPTHDPLCTFKPRKTLKSSRGAVGIERIDKAKSTFEDGQMRRLRPSQGEASNYKGARVMRPSVKMLHKQTKFNHTTKGMVTGETRESFRDAFPTKTNTQLSVSDTGNFTIKK
jgi:hypothetical protein